MTGESRQKITHLLNQTGAPFQDWCAQVVKDAKAYMHVTEYPYTWPPTNGPLTGTPGSIDIIAAHFDDGMGGNRFRGGIVYLIVECKRANNEIKNWVFPSVPLEDREFSNFIGKERINEPNTDRECKGISWTALNFPALGYGDQESFEACVQGFEINEELTARNRDQSQNIFKSLTQANTGLKALFSSKKFTVQSFEDLNHGHNRALFLPVVVTTANLYLAKYSPKDTIIPSGTISADKMVYEPRPWLTYQYPLPDYLAYGNLEKLPTFIVNAQHWGNFLKCVHMVCRIE